MDTKNLLEKLRQEGQAVLNVLEVAGQQEGDRCLQMVREFHETFNCSIAPEPVIPHMSPLALRKLAQLRHMMHQAATVALIFAENHRDDPAGLVFIRLQLIQEELTELAEAIEANNIVGALDALGDIDYVVSGAYLTLGLQDLRLPAVTEIHRSNMTKLGEDGKPIRNPAGRVVKGPNYQKPNLAQLFDKKD